MAIFKKNNEQTKKAKQTKHPHLTPKKKKPQNCKKQIYFLFIPSYASHVQTGAVQWEAVIACQEGWSSLENTFPVKPLFSNLKISTCQTEIHRLKSSVVVAVTAVDVSSAVFLCKLPGVVQMKAPGVPAMQSGVCLQFPVQTELALRWVQAVFSGYDSTASNHCLQQPLHFFLPCKLLLVQGTRGSKWKTGTPMLAMDVEWAWNGEIHTQSLLAKRTRNCCILNSFLSFTLSPNLSLYKHV